MHKFVRNLITEWRQLELPFKDAPVIVAVSGGADSVSLLLAIDELRTRKKLENRFVVAHFDHKLRPETSGSDFEVVRKLTIERKFELAHGEWKRVPGGNLEQEARNARYEFLLRTAENVSANYILTGHTMNDQAETVLMNLIRGAGPDGLSGMSPTRDLQTKTTEQSSSDLLPFPEPTVKLVRPLLSWAKRMDTEAFCRESNVEFCRDPMNEDVSFRRVWIRKVLIPMLEEVNPQIVTSLCRTAEALKQNNPKSEMPRAVVDEPTITALKAMEKPELYEFLRQWIKGKSGNLRGLELKHIEAIDRLIHSRKSGNTVELPGGVTVVKSGGKLVYSDIKVDK